MLNIYIFICVLLVANAQDTRKAKLFSLKNKDLFDNWRSFKTKFLKKYDFTEK